MFLTKVTFHIYQDNFYGTIYFSAQKIIILYRDIYYQYTVLLNINKQIMMQADVDIVFRSNLYGVCVQ